jgi:hypothetical protein
MSIGARPGEKTDDVLDAEKQAAFTRDLLALIIERQRTH